MNRLNSLHWVAGAATPEAVYITRVFNYGTWPEWQKMKVDFTSKQIEDVILKPLKGQWTKRGKAFAETLYDLKLPVEVLIDYDGQSNAS